ncbi:uncharacterized protein LOC113351921 [Papaver somniferum]|uniref:uncharacterized protein LOC113351921 n=1 Tax=Papaver somniferum TaxID=3469 RepID=UPI000E6F4938|nr:uncharacterized protein LOC113351921 [Papaver somniferum]
MDPPRRKGTRMKETNRKPNEYNPGIASLVQKKVKKKTVEEVEFAAAETREMVRLRKLEKAKKKDMKALSPPSRPPRVGEKLLTLTHRGAYVVPGTTKICITNDSEPPSEPSSQACRPSHEAPSFVFSD